MSTILVFLTIAALKMLGVYNCRRKEPKLKKMLKKPPMSEIKSRTVVTCLIWVTLFLPSWITSV
jgi:hypothetical protein